MTAASAADNRTPAPKIACHDVWKVFGRQPERVIERLSPDQTSAQILEQTGHVVAVRGVSFAVASGETFVVMGLSGSGKSTLVRCICRLTEPTRGAIVVDGQDVLQLAEPALREVRRHKISMVFQNFGLFPHRRVIENVAYGLEVRGAPRAARLARAQQMIELVGLAGWEQHYPKQLSGGMQQRVGLARALAVDPEIILFDEPFSALDPLIRREMQDELLRLQATMHKTSVFITHDFAEALKLGDHIAIMRNGQFVQVGTPEDLVLHPANDYVSAFTKDAPRAKVLSAARVMRPCPPGFAASGPRVRGTAKLETVLPILTGYDGLVGVEDAAGAVAGCLDRAGVMQALAV
ncbi:MAG: betaine/proline/choline family ABC transporter ATP-binding protein [Anaerolineales bacterium]|nr:betaine/proline/choline family ABC transporter ATP-binding protein [Anaerolineales bacterium]